MIRHEKQERTRSLHFNTESWKTNKTIDEIYSALADPENPEQEIVFPYELEYHRDGEEAIFRPETGSYQINAHQYDEEWKSTEVDFIYFGNITSQVNSKIEFYREEI